MNMNHIFVSAEDITQVIDSLFSSELLEKNTGIYEYPITDTVTLGVSFEDVEKYDDVFYNDVYIFNLFLKGEYINIEGEYRRNPDGSFLSVDSPEIDIYSLLADTCNYYLKNFILKEEEITNMKEEFIAVGVGYNFALIPERELAGIHLKESGAVRIHDENRILYKAATYEESQKIDKLLDRYEEYPIKDYAIEPVIMSGVLELNVYGFDKNQDNLSFGGYTFICDDKSIPFDFSGTSWDVYQDGSILTIPFKTGSTLLLTDYFLDDCYLDDYKELGLRMQDITAEFLSKAIEISEFVVDMEFHGEEYNPVDIAQMGGFKLKELSFSDGENEYMVNPEVLQNFNEELQKEADKTIWITVYRDSLGFPDDWDNLTSICVPTDWLRSQVENSFQTLDEWLSEYTADETEEILWKAMSEGVIVDYGEKEIREAIKEKEAVAEQNRENLDDKINSAKKRTKYHPSLEEEEYKWKVTFFRLSDDNQKHTFDVYIDMPPKVQWDGQREYWLEVDDRVRAYDKAARLIGEDALKEYVIMNAEIVSKSTMREEKQKANLQELEL